MQRKILNPKSCPGCTRELTDGSFSFDDDCSMICGHCGHTVFSTREKKQHKILQDKDLRNFNPKRPM